MPWRNPIRRLFVVLALCPILVSEGQTQPELDPVTQARQILDRVDDLWRGTSSYGVLSMKVVTENWQRTLTMEVWSKGKDYTLVRILSPLKEKGMATLKVRNEIWNWLPKVQRRIKITSAMMMGSWMGSHFTNDDLVKESRMAEDYEPQLSFSGSREEEQVWAFSLLPKPQAAVVWGKVVVVVRQKDLMPLIIDYYDEDGSKVRQMRYDDFKVLGGRLLPARLRMSPLDKPGEYTELVYQSITFDLDLDPSFFSLRNLAR